MVVAGASFAQPGHLRISRNQVPGRATSRSPAQDVEKILQPRVGERVVSLSSGALSHDEFIPSQPCQVVRQSGHASGELSR